MVNQACKIVAPAIVHATTPPAPPILLEGLEKYTGLYRSAWGDVEVVLQPKGLVLFGPTAPDPLETVMTMTPEGEHTFRTDGDNGYATIGELAVFEMDADGRVTRPKVGENYSTRVN